MDLKTREEFHKIFDAYLNKMEEQIEDGCTFDFAIFGNVNLIEVKSYIKISDDTNEFGYRYKKVEKISKYLDAPIRGNIEDMADEVNQMKVLTVAEYMKMEDEVNECNVE